MSQWDMTFLPHNKYRSHWPIFHVPLILLYILKTFWWINVILWDNESLGHDLWPHNKCRSQWLIYHGPVILFYILKTIWWINVMIWGDETLWHHWHDLWFCFIAWRLFNCDCPSLGWWVSESHNKCRSRWSIYHGPVTLLYILKAIWWISVKIWDDETLFLLWFSMKYRDFCVKSKPIISKYNFWIFTVSDYFFLLSFMKSRLKVLP